MKSTVYVSISVALVRISWCISILKHDKHFAQVKEVRDNDRYTKDMTYKLC